MDKEVLIHLLADRVRLHGWEITKVPKALQGDVDVLNVKVAPVIEKQTLELAEALIEKV